MATIIVFASSLIVLSVFVVIKAIEIKYEKRNIFCELLGKFDDASHKLVADLKFKILQFVQSARYIVLVKAKEAIKKILEKLEEKIVREYRAGHTMIMGQREIAVSGSASFYLRKISENKDNGAKGKIEESL
jgi:hypothetical protein